MNEGSSLFRRGCRKTPEGSLGDYHEPTSAPPATAHASELALVSDYGRGAGVGRGLGVGAHLPLHVP
jgi:hypothetical protein